MHASGKGGQRNRDSLLSNMQTATQSPISKTDVSRGTEPLPTITIFRHSNRKASFTFTNGFHQHISKKFLASFLSAWIILRRSPSSRQSRQNFGARKLDGICLQQGKIPISNFASAQSMKSRTCYQCLRCQNRCIKHFSISPNVTSSRIQKTSRFSSQHSTTNPSQDSSLAIAPRQGKARTSWAVLLAMAEKHTRWLRSWRGGLNDAPRAAWCTQILATSSALARSRSTTSLGIPTSKHTSTSIACGCQEVGGTFRYRCNSFTTFFSKSTRSRTSSMRSTSAGSFSFTSNFFSTRSIIRRIWVISCSAVTFT